MQDKSTIGWEQKREELIRKKVGAWIGYKTKRGYV
jgi:hypothetical protein